MASREITGNRAFIASALAVVLALAVTGITSGAAASTPTGIESVGPSPRIVNGKGASIADSPWQVALIEPKGFGAGSKPADRFFCSGSLLAPDVVVTAAHCLSGFSKSERKKIDVIAGRTWLNQTGTGEAVGVRKVVFALRPDGSRKYSEFSGSATWDVALVKLDGPLAAPVIRLAGSSESGVWNPGRKVRATGWGITSWRKSRVSNQLRVASQVIMPDAVCRRDNGDFYRTKTMVCLGGTAGHSSTCSGDSGGPLVARTSNGPRLVGLTSFGDILCRGYIPSVDTRVSGKSIRSWVREKTIELSGVDPVGSGGTAGPMPEYCRVPDLFQRSRSSARIALKRAGCSLAEAKYLNRKGRRKPRVFVSSLPADWLAPIGFGITIRLVR